MFQILTGMRLFNRLVEYMMDSHRSVESSFPQPSSPLLRHQAPSSSSSIPQSAMMSFEQWQLRQYDLYVQVSHLNPNLPVTDTALTI